MFSKILIANRGEIACRVIRTAKAMGISTVAVYSDADAQSLAVSMADEAYRIGPAPARDSYLLGERIIETALAAGAEAIHPGFGFLSENADFAEACATAGLTFIGPPASAIRAMGSKSEAKALMGAAGVPLTPGYHGDNQDAAFLADEAEKIGFPVLIKASAGGGGKGMRLVERAEDFADALVSCKREASASFGDDHCLIERFVTKPRHIEMQVFADQLGNAVHLFERDCSIQRRHQKVLEEAPAPAMPEALRERMGKAAVEAARAVSYEGAGTVEFIAETRDDGTPGDFFFMEMNTRLQVEHPVTEAITGFDLVEWQLRVAAGEPLPVQQDDIAATGHAIEARLYAEDPDGGFLPSTGTLHHLVFPMDMVGIRIDTGVRAGDDVTPHYDPMIAKIITHGSDRDQALARMTAALAATEVSGPRTNRDFLRRTVRDEDFKSGKLDTGFIERRGEALLSPNAVAPTDALIAAALFSMDRAKEEAKQGAATGTDPFSPWAQSNGWQLNGRAWQVFEFQDAVDLRTVRCRARQDAGFDISIGEDTYQVTAHLSNSNRDANDRITMTVNGLTGSATVCRQGAVLTVITADRTVTLSVPDPMAQASGGDSDAKAFHAPMPGKVVAVMVEAGSPVVAGQPLMVLEAMKMENTIKAPRDTTVAEIRVSPGDQTAEGDVLITFDDD